MTAVIGILNKNAVAIAADSAVTVSGNNGRKIYNTANKIFTLSKYHPVSIIIYNSASFITTPWEIIIKVYRNQLKETSFDKLEDYPKDFFNFLKNNDFFSSEEIIVNYNISIIYTIFEDLKNASIQKAIDNEGRDGLISIDEKARLKIFKKNLISILNQEITELKNRNKLEDFHSYKLSSFVNKYNTNIELIIKEEFVDFFDKRMIKLFSTFLFYYFTNKDFAINWSGLVFAGYGNKEIYPSTISTKIAGVLDDKIRYFIDHIEEINDGNKGSIMPFAQRDVIDTLISGISPEINETLFKTFNVFLTGYNDFLANLSLDLNNLELAEKLKQIDINSICRQLLDEIEDVKRIKHISPTVNTVSVLSKEDLAEMAESLIYLTYLKRRISSDEESVGGPVDVAIISKGDGFIWIKRKHYFEINENPQYLQNYFK